MLVTQSVKIFLLDSPLNNKSARSARGSERAAVSCLFSAKYELENGGCLPPLCPQLVVGIKRKGNASAPQNVIYYE